MQLCSDLENITEKAILAEISGLRLLKVISGEQFLKLSFSDQNSWLAKYIDRLGGDDSCH